MIITKSRLVVDQTPPEGLALIALIEAWADVLDNIPTGKLDEYYRRASRRKDNSYPVNALDIISEWNRLREQRGYDEYLPPQHQGKY